MYGYVNSNEVGPGLSGGKFGLNKAVITKFEFTDKAGASGSDGEAIDLTVTVGDREYKNRFFPINKVYAPKNGGEITDKNSEAYKKQFEIENNLLQATLSDIVKCFVNEEVAAQALAGPFPNFKAYAQALERVVKQVPGWDSKPVNVFLQYQYALGKNKDGGVNSRTFLELPKNVKHGVFLTKDFPGDYKPNNVSSGLKYVNENGEEHPIKRTSWFMENAFANQIIVPGQDDNSETGNQIPSPDGGWA